MGKLVVKGLLLLILLALLALLIPSMVPLAMAEDTVPSYTPVILTGTAIEPIDYLKKTPFATDPAATWIPPCPCGWKPCGRTTPPSS